MSFSQPVLDDRLDAEKFSILATSTAVVSFWPATKIKAHRARHSDHRLDIRSAAILVAHAHVVHDLQSVAPGCVVLAA